MFLRLDHYYFTPIERRAMKSNLERSFSIWGESKAGDCKVFQAEVHAIDQCIKDSNYMDHISKIKIVCVGIMAIQRANELTRFLLTFDFSDLLPTPTS